MLRKVATAGEREKQEEASVAVMEKEPHAGGEAKGEPSHNAATPTRRQTPGAAQKSPGMLVGYARVSTQDQNLALQNDALKEAGCQRIFEDKLSGAKAPRPGLLEALAFMRPGDTLVVWKLSRLGRSIKQLIETVQLLAEKGIDLKSLNESLDTASATGKLLFHIIAAFAQFERDNRIENTMAGLEAARARGKKGGRRRVMDDTKTAMALALRADPARPVDEICKTLHISRATFYRYTKSETSEAQSA